jgi:hypothetical protein
MYSRLDGDFYMVGADRSSYTPVRVWAGPAAPIWSDFFYLRSFDFFLFPSFSFSV